MFALAYVRVDRVEEYAKVVAELITEPVLAEFKKTFFKTWIGRLCGVILDVLSSNDFGPPLKETLRLGRRLATVTSGGTSMRGSRTVTPQPTTTRSRTMRVSLS
jgi:hypothetical protein